MRTGSLVIPRLLLVSQARPYVGTGLAVLRTLGRLGFDVEVDCGPATVVGRQADALGRGGAEAGPVDDAAGRSRPDVLMVVGDDPASRAALAAARRLGVTTALLADGFGYRDPTLFDELDAVLAPTRFAADYFREAFGVRCAVLPPAAPPGPAPGGHGGAGPVTFVDPTPEHGAYVFARIADELGRRRPDIPLRVVDTRGTDAARGPDLRGLVNVRITRAAPGDRVDWGSARACLMPGLGLGGHWVAVEALAAGVPVLASDRGELPETLGGAGRLIAIPDRLTPATETLPAAAEVGPWVEAVIELWDDRRSAESHRRKALAEARRWALEAVGPRYLQLFEALLSPGGGPGVRPRKPVGHVAGRDAGGRGGSTPGRIRGLAAAHPWPGRRPSSAGPPAASPGWLGGGTDQLLARELSADVRLVIELGAWLGLSSRYIADHAPHATVVSVDHWEGSPEHRSLDEYRGMLPTLYEGFLDRCWDYRGRIIPLRMTSLEGLQTVADFGLEPDLIYVDAEHSYEAVTSELALAGHLFPGSAVVGDDYDWAGVARAAHEYADRTGLAVERVGQRGWKLAGRGGPTATGPTPGRARSAVLVPHAGWVGRECERALRGLELAGVRVVRREVSRPDGLARSALLSEALHDGAESLLLVDPGVGFDPLDALRLLARPEQAVCGVHAGEWRDDPARCPGGGAEVVFGPDAPGLYPLRHPAAGFLRVKAATLRGMAARLGLPLCDTALGDGVWPFFMPTTVPHAGGGVEYLDADRAFGHRLGLIGVTPLADTSVRLRRLNRHDEDACPI